MFGTRFDKPEKSIDLSRISTVPPKDFAREDAEAEFQELGEELFDLQQLMYGAGTHSLLMVLQGRDAAGKDGTVKHVVGHLNPRGVRVVSFGVPTDEEREHDFLWRVHRHAPRRGHVVIFNRSHYEQVLVVRVDELSPEEQWRSHYAQINAFESLLASANTIILKFFLHITPDEQAERFIERESDPRKSFKLNVKDWQKRTQWDDYTAAYGDAIARCSSEHAPWVVVPADKKWFRNLVVARALRDALLPYKDAWQLALDRMGVAQRASLEDYRNTPEGARIAAAVAEAAGVASPPSGGNGKVLAAAPEDRETARREAKKQKKQKRDKDKRDKKDRKDKSKRDKKRDRGKSEGKRSRGGEGAGGAAATARASK